MKSSCRGSRPRRRREEVTRTRGRSYEKTSIHPGAVASGPAEHMNVCASKQRLGNRRTAAAIMEESTEARGRASRGGCGSRRADRPPSSNNDDRKLVAAVCKLRSAAANTYRSAPAASGGRRRRAALLAASTSRAGARDWNSLTISPFLPPTTRARPRRVPHESEVAPR